MTADFYNNQKAENALWLYVQSWRFWRLFSYQVFLLIRWFSWQTIKTNVMGTLNMLGLAKRVGARYGLIFVSFADILLLLVLGKLVGDCSE